MSNQCSDEHPGAVSPTFQKDILPSPKEPSLREHSSPLENSRMDMPHSPAHLSRQPTLQRQRTNSSTQPVEFDFCSCRSPEDPSQQGQNDGMHSTSVRMKTTRPQNPQTCPGVLGTSPTDHDPEVLDPDGHYVSLGNLLTDPTSGLLHKGDLESKFYPQEPTGNLLDDMETCNDSSNNDLNESDENGKESTDKSCSDFQPPSCSSNAFSLMMADSEHNPSTSGYSSEQPAKAKTQKDLMKILKELRSYLPPEKRSRGKSSTLASLRYALHCIQQVKANEEYYQLLMVNEKQPCGLDVSCYTIQEIANITSEYTKNNMDVFAAAVSLVTGQILYISEQASVVLRCGADVFSQVRFVELLAPQDVSVFYSSTTPYRLPSWSICNGTDLGSRESLEEKSFYCRISCGRESRREIYYHPFRVTPYLIRAQIEDSGSEQLCCVLFAERVHSGYEAPRIPADKRIFTTTHTPSCLFQDVDERAVPLLGYLPQDLIGSPMIMHLHPSDRPLMLAVHKKILQYGGQPFDFSPIRFCARNGEYVTIDTSWSSFINPWSRKVSFIIGRHKVRMGPVNEDIFTATPGTEDQSLQPGVQEITEQIHQLLMQPVHNSSSSGYGSLGSNGSHENPTSAGSSSDSNGNLNEEVKDKHATSLVQNMKHGSSSLECNSHQNPKKQAVDLSSAAPHCNGIAKDMSGSGVYPAQPEELPVKPHPYSYQQVNCLDSIIRYLESCNVHASAKRKWVSSCNTLSSTSDEDRNQMQEQNVDLQKDGLSMGVGMQLGDQSLSAIIPKLPGPTPCQYPNSLFLEHMDPGPAVNALSEVACKNHCLLQPPMAPIAHLSGPGPHPSLASLPVPGPSSIPVLTPLPLADKAESVVSLTSHCSYSSTIVHVGDKKLQPEIEFENVRTQVKVVPPEKEPCRRLGLTKEILLAHTQKEENDFLSGFMDVKKLSAFRRRCNSYLHERPGATRSRCPQGSDTPWKKTGKNRKPKAKRVRPESWDSSSSGVPYPPRHPLPGLNTTAWSQSDTSLANYPPLPYPMLPAYTMPVFPPQPIPATNENTHVPPSSTCSVQPFTAPMFPPVMALVMPNYMYPPNMPPVIYPIPGQPPAYTPQTPFPVAQPTFPIPQPTFPVPQPVISVPQHAFPVPQTSYAPQPVQSLYHGQSALHPHLPSAPKVKEGISRCSTPRNPQSPLLFQSRCSSPLQLNLLQLEESQKAERSELVPGLMNTTTILPQPIDEPHLRHCRAESPADAQTSDAMSACSDLMDMLLNEDASCGTCSTSSAVSESLASESRRHGTSGSQTGSSLTSCSSKYFGSVDSSENNQLRKQTQGKETASTETAIKYVLQDPMWLLVANADENVMMTYQIPLRDVDTVLREDKEKLKCLQKLQPRFTDEQKKELGEIHPWIQRGSLPQAMEDCVYCREKNSDCAEYGETIQALELSGILESCD